MQALHEAISILSLQLFNLSTKWSTAEVCTSNLNLTHSSPAVRTWVDNFLCLLFGSQILMH